MIRRLSLMLLGLAMFVVAGQQVHGSLIMLNDPSIDTAIANGQFGGLSAVSSNGFNLTFDNETNLEWLDVSVTLGLSRAAVMTRMATGGVLEGFRYATTAELSGFMSKNGITVPESATGAAALPKIASAQSFTHIWGGDFEMSGGFTIGEYLTLDGTVFLAYRLEANPYYEIFATSFTGDVFGGHALVRTPIPEPSSLLFFGLAGYILQGIRFRRAVA